MTHIVIVGGGAAGCALAARLSEDPACEVTLIEAGSAEPTPPELLEGAAIPAAVPGHPANWGFDAELMPGIDTIVPRGRVLGGSSTINGGYFVRPRPADFATWSDAGGEAWSYKNALPLLTAMENDLDFGGEPGHGAEGPIRLQRPSQRGELASAFVLAAVELGFPLETDKNGLGEVPGAGAVPSNIIDGVRINTAMAYLGPAISRSNLHTLGDTRALRMRVEGSRVTGVEVSRQTSDGLDHGVDHGVDQDVDHDSVRYTVPADEVVLCAGAVITPQLLMLSGIGPREELAAHGISLVADLPVGEGFSDHPNLAVAWQPTRPLLDPQEHFAFPTALNFSSGSDYPDGDLEILLVSKPVGSLFDSNATPEFGIAEADMQLLVALQAPASRGRLRLRSANPLERPHIEYHYLDNDGDRMLMRLGVRTAADLLRSDAFSGLFAGSALDSITLADDDLLDAWIRAHLGTAIHMCGTAQMGSVVDGAGKVLGVEGLRVADTSILPTVPSRGTFASAVLVGELIARQMRAESTGQE